MSCKSCSSSSYSPENKSWNNNTNRSKSQWVPFANLRYCASNEKSNKNIEGYSSNKGYECKGCDVNGYSSMNRTWSELSSLNPTYWHPYEKWSCPDERNRNKCLCP